MRVSRVVPSFDLEGLSRSYRVARVQSDKGYVDFSSRTLDAGTLEGEVEATARLRGDGAVYVLFGAKTDCVPLMRRLIQEVGDETLRFEVLTSLAAVPTRVLVTLLLNALARSRFDTMAASNVGGGLIMVHPDHIAQKGDVIHGLAVSVDKDMCLELGVCTFTKLSRFPHGLQKKYAALPRYVVKDSVFLYRFDRASKSETYVNRALGTCRYAMNFLDVGSKARFGRCKLGMLADVLRRFSIRYGSTAVLEFEELEGSEVRRAIKTANSSEWRRRLASLIEGPIGVIDTTGSPNACAIVAKEVKRLFGVTCAVADDHHGCCAIKLIHDADTYGDGLDPYKEDRENGLVQHLVVDNVVPKVGNLQVSAEIESCVKELVIKRDVNNCRLTMVDWDSLGIGSPWTFGVRVGDDAQLPEYAFVEVSSGGSLRFTLEGDLRGMEHFELIRALMAEEVDVVICGPDGDINVIQRRELFSVPDFESMAASFVAGDVTAKGSLHRTAAEKEGMFADVLDAVFVADSKDHGYYRVSEASASMRANVARASILREVTALEGSRLLFPEALCLLDVDFVRMRQATVVPFPVKYLREWLLRSATLAGTVKSLLDMPVLTEESALTVESADLAESLGVKLLEA